MSEAAVVKGQKAIARELRCSIATMKRWQRLPSDPLRLWSSEHDRRPWALRSRLVAYRLRRQEDPAAVRIVSWAGIAALVVMSVDQAQRLERRQEDPLPVARDPHGGVWAYKDALLDWLDAQNRPHVLRGGPTTREDVCPPRPKAARRAS